jgi:predicted nucleic acid-binding protein
MANRSFVLDTSALIAFIEEEEGAERVRQVICEETIIIPWICLLEVVYVTRRELGETEARLRYALLKALDAIFIWQTDETILLTAARLKADKRLSLADAVIAAIAVQQAGILLHKDPEYATLEDLLEMEALPSKTA